MTIDRADWHSGGDYPRGLPEECGGTHIGMFLAWVIENDLVSKELRGHSDPEIERVRQRQMTGRDFLFACCEGRLWKNDLNATGVSFANAYYTGLYLDDYEQILSGTLPSVYHVENTWENYDRIATVITFRFASCQNGEVFSPSEITDRRPEPGPPE